MPAGSASTQRPAQVFSARQERPFSVRGPHVYIVNGNHTPFVTHNPYLALHLLAHVLSPYVHDSRTHTTKSNFLLTVFKDFAKGKKQVMQK